jgi:hypothetical protein
MGLGFNKPPLCKDRTAGTSRRRWNSLGPAPIRELACFLVPSTIRLRFYAGPHARPINYAPKGGLNRNREEHI